MQIGGAFVHSQALHAAVALGIADELRGGPVPVHELAARAGVQADPLRRVLRAVASQGLFEEARRDWFREEARMRSLLCCLLCICHRLRRPLQVSPGVFANNRNSAVLRSDHPASVSNMLRTFGERCAERVLTGAAGLPGLPGLPRHMPTPVTPLLPHTLPAGGESFRAHGKLLDSLRPGSPPAFELSSGGLPFFEWLSLPGNEQRSATFDRAMVEAARSANPATLAGYPWARHANATMADVGGGLGAWLAALLSHHPTMQGLLVDLPAVVAHAGQRHVPLS